VVVIPTSNAFEWFIPSGCCSPRECVHPQAAFQRRSSAVGPGEFLGLDIVDGVGRLNLEGDGLARKGLDEAIGNKSASKSLLLSPSHFRLSGELTFAL